MTYRLAELSDVKLYFDWANDPEVRQQSHNTEPIIWGKHITWFNKMLDSDALMLVFFDEGSPVGQIRVDNDECISLSVDAKHRGKGVATAMLKTIVHLFDKSKRHMKGEVKQSNIASIKAFEKAGFKLDSVVSIKGVECNVYVI